MAKKKRTDSTIGNISKARLSGTPFKSMAELNAASAEILNDTWRQMEKARIKRELTSKEEYRFFLEPFRKGMLCRYGEKNDGLVRVYLTPEDGIHVDISEEMRSAENSEALLNALIRSTSDSLFSNYLKSMDIIAPSDSNEDTDPTPRKNPKK